MTIRDVIDVAAVAAAAGAVADILPTISAFLASVWTFIRIYEWARAKVVGRFNQMQGREK